MKPAERPARFGSTAAKAVVVWTLTAATMLLLGALILSPLFWLVVTIYRAILS